MLFFVGLATRLNDVWQDFLELLAVHFVHPLPTCFAGEPCARHPLSQAPTWLPVRAMDISSRSAPFYRRAAFSALLSFSRSRSFMRALCNCDLLFPIEHPIISAISLCSYPSTSCKTKMILYPGGRLSIARSRFTRSIDPASTLSLAPISFFGPSSCCGSSASSRETSGNPFLRRCISTTFTASRCSHVENADSPRNVAIFL